MGAYKKTHQENFPDTCRHGETVQYIENWLIGDFPKPHSEKSKKDRETCNDNFFTNIAAQCYKYQVPTHVYAMVQENVYPFSSQ